MSDIAISVDHISKQFRIGQQEPYRRFSEMPRRWAGAAWHGLCRGVSRLSARDQASAKGRGPSVHRNGTIWALKDVSFEVQRGEVLGIIGRNGSGKSTLLKILTRITKPTTGAARLRGRVGSLLEVGSGFHPELTGRENIYLNGTILGMRKTEIDRKFDEIVAFAEIEQFLDTPVKHYSSGMYMRLAFAIAAHLEPEILLVDEVLAVGDAAFQKKCLGKMGEVAQQGRTVLFVSHNMASIRSLCPHSILLCNGRATPRAESWKVIEAYQSQWSHDASGDCDLRDPALRHNSLADSRFQWTRIRLLNGEGAVTGRLRLREPFAVVLEGRVKEDATDLRVGFSIDSDLGIALFNSFQTDDGLSDRFCRGPVKLTVRFESNCLAPGTYSIGLGANGPGAVDWIPAALSFSVDVTGKGERCNWKSYHTGVIVPYLAWSIAPSNSHAAEYSPFPPVRQCS